jgi:acyl carrier protein
MTIAISNFAQWTATRREVLAANDVRTLIANHLGIDVKRVTDEARFTDDLGVDWFDRLEVMILIEDHFDVEIPDENVGQMEVVGDLIRHIETVNNERQQRGADPVIRKLFGPGLARVVKPTTRHQEGREQSAFFLRLANDAMRGLSSRCAVTKQPVELPIYADYATLARIRSNLVRFQCPRCGAEHQMKVEAACAEAS